MNCQEAELMIAELARGVDAGEPALAHVKGCPRCSERLAEEERLTAGLSAWAEAMSGEQAPPRVEQQLREAFRQGAAPARHARRWIPWVAAGSIAAAVLLFKAFTSPGPAAPVVVSILPVPLETAPVAPVPTKEQLQVAAPKPNIRPGRRTVRPVRDPEPAQAQLDFLPVPQGDAWTPRDGGRLVRVGLPRSALRAFGLPMMEERAQEQVQADVVLSHDGLLRAIRFVQ